HVEHLELGVDALCGDVEIGARRAPRLVDIVAKLHLEREELAPELLVPYVDARDDLAPHLRGVARELVEPFLDLRDPRLEVVEPLFERVEPLFERVEPLFEPVEPTFEFVDATFECVEAPVKRPDFGEYDV